MRGLYRPIFSIFSFYFPTSLREFHAISKRLQASLATPPRFDDEKFPAVQHHPSKTLVGVHIHPVCVGVHHSALRPAAQTTVLPIYWKNIIGCDEKIGIEGTNK